jgi:NitT/TauT family transport system permease protein
MNRWLMQIRLKHKIGWPDLVVVILIAGTLYAILDLGKGMNVPFSIKSASAISLDPKYLPYYAGRSLLRMFIAYLLSLTFTLVYGRYAAYHKTAEKFMIPALDILQSVPVLGFLSITVTGFLALFPKTLLGAEFASIFAIFTSQVWNMTFSFYHSLTIIPEDLKEASKIYRLRAWAQFVKLEVPFSMIGLVWNSMMSFGGAWFFLAASESITVLHNHIQLPGIGSYMAEAIAAGNIPDQIYGILTMVIVIIAVDQLVWRPLVAWSQKFILDQNSANEAPSSWFLQLLRRSEWVQNSFATLGTTMSTLFPMRLKPTTLMIAQVPSLKKRPYMRWLLILVWSIILLFALRYVLVGIADISKLGWGQIIFAIKMGFYTFLRVTIATILGALWTVPVGVAIGLNRNLSKVAQPLVQVFSSFPFNLFFGLIAMLYMAFHINFDWGSIPLMMLGTQWYILFNVIAGTMAIPTVLKEASLILRLHPIQRWKTLILPAIFPNLVTGLITASGGAWNASIVAEIVNWKNHTLIASGLGSYIANATMNGNWAEITLGIAVMSIFVVLINRVLWRPMYRLAENKYHLE